MHFICTCLNFRLQGIRQQVAIYLVQEKNLGGNHISHNPSGSPIALPWHDEMKELQWSPGCVAFQRPAAPTSRSEERGPEKLPLLQVVRLRLCMSLGTLCNFRHKLLDQGGWPELWPSRCGQLSPSMPWYQTLQLVCSMMLGVQSCVTRRSGCLCNHAERFQVSKGLPAHSAPIDPSKPVADERVTSLPSSSLH